jgi:uncharacterized protein
LHTTHPTSWVRGPERLLAALVLAATLLLFGGAMLNRLLDPGRLPPSWLETLASYFLAICLEAAPFILLGALLTALLEEWLPAQTLPRLTARLGLWGVPAVALLAPVFPVCECGVIMVARGLARKGLPLPHVVTYLLAAPIVNPTVLAATYIAYQDLSHPWWRGLGGIVVSVAVGWAVAALKPRRGLLEGHAPLDAPAGPALQTLDDLLAPAPASPCDCGREHLATPAGAGRFPRLARHLVDDFAEMMPYFLAGVLLASLIKTFVSGPFLASLGSGAFSGPLVMMILAAVLSLCSEADAFVAASFVEFSFPAHLAFLLLGPMFDLKLLMAYRIIFTPGFIALFCGLVWLGVALFTGGVALWR